MIRTMWQRLPRGVRALIEVGILFLPGIPAYLWLWPNVENTDWLKPVQVLVYLYFLAGCFIIGRRRWSWDQLGLNLNGIGLTLICGAVLIAGRVLVTLSVAWPNELTPVTPGQLIGDIVFYFVLVGFIEELLFRGVIYRAFDEWREVRWAIWGSAVMFGIYHVGWQGVAAVGALLYGVIFAVIRWRAGGIIGLIIMHGLIDVLASLMLPDLDILKLGRPVISSPLMLIVGYALILIVPIYLWKFYHPRSFHWRLI
jgi:membrane protease YdiL (CAAX protease family)